MRAWLFGMTKMRRKSIGNSGCRDVRRRSCAAERPNWYAHFAGFIGEVLRDPGTGESDEADGECFEHGVIALEGCGVFVAGPVGLEDDLLHLSVISPAGGDAFRAFRRSAMDQHHVGMFFVGFVEGIPDTDVIVTVSSAGESDPWSGG